MSKLNERTQFTRVMKPTVVSKLGFPLTKTGCVSTDNIWQLFDCHSIFCPWEHIKYCFPSNFGTVRTILDVKLAPLTPFSSSYDHFSVFFFNLVEPKNFGFHRGKVYLYYGCPRFLHSAKSYTRVDSLSCLD
jgi:hypothetical protein